MDTKRTVFFRGVARGKVSGLSQERCWCCKGESSYRSPNEAQRRVVDRTHSNVVSSVVGERAVRINARPTKLRSQRGFHVRFPKCSA